MGDDRNLYYSAPVLPFDYQPDGKPIWPCTECLPWHVEVVMNDVDGLIIREWHAVGCSSLQEDRT